MQAHSRDWSNVASALLREVRRAEQPVIVLDIDSDHRALANSLHCRRKPVGYLPPAEVHILAACHKTHGTLVCIDGDQYDSAFAHFLSVFLPIKIIIVCGAEDPCIITGDMRARTCRTDPGDGRLIVYELDINGAFCILALVSFVAVFAVLSTHRHVHD